MDFVQVAEEEGEEPIELPAEEDGTLLMSTLQAQFPASSGLKYRNIETKVVRGVRSNEGRLFPPSVETGWGTSIFFCVFPKENKRKSDDNLDNCLAKTKRIETRFRCSDLIVLGLPWKTTEESLRHYFEGFGEVLMAQVKKDLRSGQSKGFGFVRFGSHEAQMRVLSSRHLIDGRWCDVKVPNSKGMIHQVPCKVFVGRCTEDIKADDLREYFSKFGEVTDVFIPKPFRAFSFVTFLDPEVAQSLCGEDHIIRGVSVHVSNAAPKAEQNRSVYQNHHSLNCDSPGVAGIGIHEVHYKDNAINSVSDRNGHIRRSNANIMKADSSGMGVHYDRMVGCGTSETNYNSVGRYSNGRGGHGASHSGVINRRETQYLSYNRGSNCISNHFIGHGNSVPSNGGWNNQQNRGHLDMPNLQALGITPQRQNSNQGQNVSNALGMGINLNSLQMNPAIVAAALNQWSLLGNQMPSQQEQQSGNFLSWMAKVGGTSNADNSEGNRGANNANYKDQGSSQVHSSTPCNELQQKGSSGSVNQSWSSQNNAGASHDSKDKPGFI